MSRTTLKAAFADGDMINVKEYRNSWRGAVMIWSYLAERYLGEKWYPGSDGLNRRLWDLAEAERVPFIERVALATTFDRVLVQGADRELLHHCLMAMATLLPAENSLAEQAKDILALAASVRAIGWQQTSVAADFWWVEGDEEAFDGRPYNIDKDSVHWWLFLEVRP